MENKEEKMLVPDEIIIKKIYLIRGRKVITDKDLARLYQVSTGNLNKAVRRNIRRFPDDFMFKLTRDEEARLMFQSGISSWGGNRKLTYVFTEQGIAMLSGILHSERAIRVNIAIMRAFVQLRMFLESNKELERRLDELEKAVGNHDDKIDLIFSAIRELTAIHENPEERTPVGFRIRKE